MNTNTTSHPAAGKTIVNIMRTIRKISQTYDVTFIVSKARSWAFPCFPTQKNTNIQPAGPTQGENELQRQTRCPHGTQHARHAGPYQRAPASCRLCLRQRLKTVAVLVDKRVYNMYVINRKRQTTKNSCAHVTRGIVQDFPIEAV